jgi:penicillin-binding protein 2
MKRKLSAEALKIPAISGVFAVCLIFLLYRVNLIINDDGYISVIAGRGKYTLQSFSEYGNIYDRNLYKYTNNEIKFEAVVIPGSDSATAVLPYVIDRDAFLFNIKSNLPFLCEITADGVHNPDLTVFTTKKRTASLSAPHIIGYTSENSGVAGIERAYNDELHRYSSVNSITFNVDAVGNVLEGLDTVKTTQKTVDAGLVLTIDEDIQSIVLTAAKNNALEKGAVVVTDVHSGEILASASFPTFEADNIEDYLTAADAPLVNRAFSAFPVGSIFKLTTAAEAFEEGISPDYCYLCKGVMNLPSGQRFSCHVWSGHGQIDIRNAIVYSCNPFFIALNADLRLNDFRNRCVNFGFGEETVFGEGLVSNAGYLPTYAELQVPAERANISFGQGKLTATPLQVSLFTSAIANGGNLPEAQLVYGKYENGKVIKTLTETENPPVISETTAEFLRSCMKDTIEKSVRSALPESVTAGGKTSTAQTGRFKEDGTEIVNVWFTGFFPYDNPKYAVTVLAEDGKSGSETAAPVFREIADKISKLYENQ